eukprot:TRINITY_DN183_c0_g2_i1.p6 TRINITY_DN183_c0_g2~~TRINITY_DN183_c0_g2_i1.p6  ORF type:complete len:106 (-),score=10.17 TRINITY_DN183_c0_g2_i1:63-380(-)
MVLRVIWKERIEKDNCITLVKQTYNTNKKIAKIMDAFGPENRFAGYVVYHFCSFVLASVFAYGCYFYYWANAGFIGLLFLSMVWQGSKSTISSIYNKNKGDSFRY